jgi:hypothetical protein
MRIATYQLTWNNMNKLLTKLVFAALAAVSVAAQATTIDFSTLPYNTAVTNQFAGVTFSLDGGNAYAGPATTNGMGLTNTSSAGGYPTARYIVASFAPTVTDVIFKFNNAGNNGANAYFLYDGANSLITSGMMSGSGDVIYDVSAFTGVREIRWDNGLPMFNGGNWWQMLNSISYTEEAAAAVPEPASFVLLGLGLAGLAASRRKFSK